MTLENGRLIIDLTGSLLTLLIIGFWVAVGWSEGFRYIVTIGLFVTLGYLLTVRADVIVSFVNGIYSFVIRFFNFISPNLASIFPESPIIPENAEAPLLLRVIVFFLLLAIGVGWKGPWEARLPGWSGGNQQMRLLGAFTGFYIGVLFVSAIATFWQAGSAFVNFSDNLAVILNSLPTLTNIIPVFLAAFIFLMIIVSLNLFLRGLPPSPPPKR
ncbi:MAG TPA: hypothetical protein VFU22_22995 [Roseiflexaceae bacterium]|nr:hypothetical protein [Roseiflexaceae bacterium]